MDFSIEIEIIIRTLIALKYSCWRFLIFRISALCLGFSNSFICKCTLQGYRPFAPHLQICTGPQSPVIVNSRGVLFQSIHRVLSGISVLTCGWWAAHSSLVTALIRLSLSLGNRASPLARSDCWCFVFVGVTSIFQTWRGNKWAHRQIEVRNSG